MESANTRKARTISERLGALASLASSAETIYNRTRKIPQLGDWQITRSSHFDKRHRLQKTLDLVSNPKTSTALHLVKVAANAILLLSAEPKTRKQEIVRGSASLVSASIGTMLSPASRYGSDGADQANMVTQYANGISALSSDTQIRELSTWFVSIQGMLSYAVAGYAKLFGRPWREGDAVRDIVRTRAYGSEKFWKLINKKPKTARFISHAVVAWECIFPLIYVFPKTISKTLLYSAIIFHVANGPIMGLWRFIFSFSAFHPAMHQTIENASIPKSVRNLIALSVFGTATVYAILTFSSKKRANAIEDYYENLEKIITSSGSTLPIDLDEVKESDIICVFENGLMALPEQFHLVRTSLKEAGISTLTYTRASSSPQREPRIGSTETFETMHAAADLKDVIKYTNQVLNYKKIVLIGHSYGGEIVRTTLGLISELELKACAILLDPTHPNQFAASKLQNASRVTFSDHLNVMHTFVKLGFGSLITTPEWLLTLPDDLQKRGTEIFRDQLLWQGAKAEWGAVLQEMHGNTFRQIDNSEKIPLAVISAERTTNLDAELKSLHEQLASWEYFSLADATHVSMLANKKHAKECSEKIISLITEWKHISQGEDLVKK